MLKLNFFYLKLFSILLLLLHSNLLVLIRFQGMNTSGSKGLVTIYLFKKQDYGKFLRKPKCVYLIGSIEKYRQIIALQKKNKVDKMID
jgi:hypothetical protein